MNKENDLPATPAQHGWTRWRRPLLWGLLVALALWAAAWFGGPPLIKSQIEKQGSKALGRELRVASLEVFPSRLAITLNDVTLAAAAGSPEVGPQLRIGTVALDLDSRSLLRLAPVVESLRFEALQLHLTRLSEGHYDIDDLLERFAAPPQGNAPQKPQRFALFNLQLHDADIVFVDRPVARRHEIAALNLDVPFLSNLPDDLQIKVKPRLSFVLDGSRFDIGGQTTPFAEGRASQFNLRFSQLALAPWWAYVPRSVPLRLLDGTLNSDLVLRFEQTDKGENHVGLSGSVLLQGVRIHDAADAPLLEWQALKLQVAELLPLEHRLRLQSVALDGAKLFVQRDAAGQLNLQRLLPQPDAGAATATPGAAPAPSPWRLQLDQIGLGDASVLWHDDSLQPAAELTLHDIKAQLSDLRWPSEGDSELSLDGVLGTGGEPVGQVHLQGPLSDRHAKLAFEIKGLQLAAAAPYLRERLRPQLAGELRASGQIDWARGQQPRQLLDIATLRVDALQLSQAAKGDRHAQRAAKNESTAAKLASAEVSGLRADLLQRRLQIAKVQLTDPFLDLSRDASGHFDAADWLMAQPAAAQSAPAAPSGEASDWTAQLDSLSLTGGYLQFHDAVLGPVPLLWRSIDLSVTQLAWPLVRGQTWRTQLGARLSRRGVDSPAKLSWNGSIGVQPALARGRLRIERVPIQVFEPYFGKDMPVVLKAAEGGFKGNVDLQQRGEAMVGHIDGDALLADVHVKARGSDDELLSWNALAADSLKVDLTAGGKPLVEVGELRLSDYYARLEITEKGQFNLQQVAASEEKNDAATVPAAPQGAASATVSASRLSRLPIDLVFGGVQLSNGRVDFNDHFIRPNYSAELSALDGHIGPFDTRRAEPAVIDLKGRVGGTGLLQIDGTVNPTTEPPALDIAAKASDIELPGLTPYAAKYAGYPIERGKLSVDVKYKIDATGKLEARNHIILNQLTFGKKTDSPDATSLPVRLAVALLQDSHGVIDIDLPVSGSINDPQFSIGGLIIKAIVNLLTKAITAPFALLAGGGGPDLSVVGFAPGSASIDAKSREVIDKVAKALADRPALKLTITGEADAAAEAQAMRERALNERIVAEQRSQRARESLGKTAAADAPLPPLSDEQRARIIKRLYVEAELPDSPMTTAGTLKELPVADMRARLLAAVPVNAATARQLAVERGRAVREALIAKGLSSERLFLAEPKPKVDAGAQKAANAAPSAAQAQLSLSPL